MTLEEKAGQLVNYSAHRREVDYEAMVRAGSAGSFLNAAFDWVQVSESGVYQENPNGTLIEGARRINRLQRIAMNEARLSIPLLIAHDVIHGFRSIFPVPLAMASSWQPDLVERAARVAAIEAASVGVRWTFAPMVDVSRDPRWGRVVEGAGEDARLQGWMGAATVRGFQGRGLAEPDAVAATAKHWVGYGAAEGGRDYATVDVSERTLREVYFPPFRETLRAGATAVMPSFNEIAGVPATVHPFTMRRVLRGEWGFDGVVVSDWGAIAEMVEHGAFATLEEAVIAAIEAGVDIDMESGGYALIPGLVRTGKISEATLDAAVRRVLRFKMQLGLFERPFVDEAVAPRLLAAPEHLAVAREVARASLVLLKNRGETLPLSPSKRVALVGALADSARDQLGSWIAAGATGDCVTVRTAWLREAGADLRYARGAAPESFDESGIAVAVETARQADVVVAVVGETAAMSGEARSRSSLDLPGAQNELLRQLRATGRPLVVVLMTGRPLASPWVDENADAVVQAWFGGSMAGPALVDVLLGRFAPVGRLPMTVPRSVGQVPRYYNHKNTGRPKISRYEDEENAPLYPFGFGLTYTRFEYGPVKIENARIGPTERARVSVEVRNAGARSGTEVVQLYVRDLVGSTTRPVRELKGLQRINLVPGETRRVLFELGDEDLSVLDADGRIVVEPGEFEIEIGPHAGAGSTTRLEVLRSAVVR